MAFSRKKCMLMLFHGILFYVIFRLETLLSNCVYLPGIPLSILISFVLLNLLWVCVSVISTAWVFFISQVENSYFLVDKFRSFHFIDCHIIWYVYCLYNFSVYFLKFLLKFRKPCISSYLCTYTFLKLKKNTKNLWFPVSFNF